jgi:hypothetical protein
MRVNGGKAPTSERVGGYRYGKTDRYMKAGGGTIKLTAGED